MEKAKIILGHVLFIASFPFYLLTFSAFLLSTVMGWTGDIGSDYGVSMRVVAAALFGLNLAVTFLGHGLKREEPVKLQVLMIILCCVIMFFLNPKSGS